MNTTGFNIARQTLWIVSASRIGAEVYELSGSPVATATPGSARQALRFVEEIPHPEGRAKNRDINTARDGSRKVGGARVGSQHGVENADATTHLAETFADSVAQHLAQAFSQNQFEGLVLVSEPGFLGILRAALNPNLAKHVVATINKNWVGLTDAEVQARIIDEVPELLGIPAARTA